MVQRKGLAGFVTVVIVAALMPATASAHPCTSKFSVATASFLSLNTAAWGGALPPLTGDDDCAPSGDVKYGAVTTDADAAPDPVGDAVSSFVYTSNLRPLGYSARNLPLNSSLSGINSDLAFKDDLVIQGNWDGFRIIDVADPANPIQLVNYAGCAHPSGQGDVVVYGNLLIWTADAPADATNMCGGELAGLGFEGVHLFDISNPSSPQYIRKVRMASGGNESGAPSGCGAHTATAVPDPARDNLYLYVGGSSGSCMGMDIVRIKLSDPTQASYLRRANANRQCHDNNVILGSVNLALCAGGNGFSVFKFDPSVPADAAGGIANPALLYSKTMGGVGIAHSGSFSYDGKVLIFGHEPGGGSQPNCQAGGSVVNKSLFFMDPLTGNQLGVLVHPRPQTDRENCTWHNFNVIPTYKGNIAVSGSYQAGISVIDFTNPALPKEIASADPAPLSTTSNVTGGDWSTYIHNGVLYESDIRRGLIAWDLVDAAADRARTFALSNPQTQAISYAQDTEGPAIDIAAPLDGSSILPGATVLAAFSCADADSGLVSCVGTVADGAAIDTTTPGDRSFTVTAADTAGNVSTKTVGYKVAFPDRGGPASVAATLSLTMGAPATFAMFTPGVAKDYTATTTVNVVATTSNARLSVADPSPTNAGKLVNGAFFLPQTLQASATGTSAPVGASASPLSLRTYTGPVINDVTVTFTQPVSAGDVLRTGTYSKSLTFTLATTTP